MKFDKEVIEQVDEENQTQEGRAKKRTSNAKNYTSQYTGLGLHKMFAALPEEEKDVLRTTCFAPLLLIDPIATMLTLVVEIFDHHLDDVLRLNLLKIILSFLLPNKGRNVGVKYADLADNLVQFNRFPWGEQVYKFLWSQIVECADYRSAAGKKLDKSLSLHRCTWVLMI
ncbi:hypothetical protein GIB67_022044 [Kingdonia uniflora]|uniref:DUF1985 domain-containing protein n=1 Tax=Kingdonia uniflora TaxID=39325 RepID=A0A7J7MUF5_9MAGN|nr:hypothetical protein GIB67_022044 [Kingdonia uniflora]